MASNSELKGCEEHILWIVRNHPGTVLGAFCGPFLAAHADHEFLAALAKEWSLIGTQSDDPVAVTHGADYLSYRRPDEAERLHRRACELDPSNAQWPKKLGEHLLHVFDYWQLELTYEDGESGRRRCREIAARARVAFRDASALSTDEQEQIALTGLFARAALLCGDLVSAKESCHGVLKRAPMIEDEACRTGLVYAAYQTLGRVHLRQGDTYAAE